MYITNSIYILFNRYQAFYGADVTACLSFNVSREDKDMRILLTAIGLASIVLTYATVHDSPQSTNPDIEYPEGYEQTFTNYLSLDRTQNPDQIIRLFGNDIAMQGPDDDGKLPYGSVLVAEVYKAKKDADGKVLTSALGRRIRGDLALIAVMQREEGWGESYPESLRNGNWDFAAFKPNGEVADKNLDACRACHAPLKSMNHVFSYEHFTQ